MSTKLIDTKNSARSLLLLKPMNVVEHAGGKKMLPGDECYQGFVLWIKDYVAFSKAAVDNAKTTDNPKTTDNAKGPDKKPAPTPAADNRKFIELSVNGLKSINDNFKLREALSRVAGVKSVVIDRKANGPSPVKVYFDDKEPDLSSLIEAVAKSGFKGAKPQP
jgi:hypothetical protein